MSSLRYDPAHRSHPPSNRTLARSPERSRRWGEPGMLSIVIPAKNEAESLPHLVKEAAEAFRPLLLSAQESRLSSFEILIVDDGSTDDTQAVLSRLMVGYSELRTIHLVKNVGQSAATVAGFREARGEWVALLDADLQNRPIDLVKLWNELPGFDAALGWRTKREDVLSKRFISRWANRIRNAVLGQSIKDTGCSVRIFSREMALRLPAFKGFHRFLGPLLLREGCRIVEVPVTHRPRANGVSHYNFWNRSYQVVLDLIGVAWLMRRGVRYDLAHSGEPIEPASRVPAPHLALSTISQGSENRQEAA